MLTRPSGAHYARPQHSTHGFCRRPTRAPLFYPNRVSAAKRESQKKAGAENELLQLRRARKRRPAVTPRKITANEQSATVTGSGTGVMELALMMRLSKSK